MLEKNKEYEILRKNAEYCLAVAEIEVQTANELLKRINEQNIELEHMTINLVKLINKLREVR